MAPPLKWPQPANYWRRFNTWTSSSDDHRRTYRSNNLVLPLSDNVWIFLKLLILGVISLNCLLLYEDVYSTRMNLRVYTPYFVN